MTSVYKEFDIKTKITHMQRSWGTLKNFLLAFIDEL